MTAPAPYRDPDAPATTLVRPRRRRWYGPLARLGRWFRALTVFVKTVHGDKAVYLEIEDRLDGHTDWRRHFYVARGEVGALAARLERWPDGADIVLDDVAYGLDLDLDRRGTVTVPHHARGRGRAREGAQP